MSTSAAILRRVGWIDSFNGQAGAFSLASQSHQKVTPATVGNGARKLGGDHSSDIEILNNNLLPFGNQPSGYLPMEILPCILHPIMKSGYNLSLPVSVAASFLLAGEAPLFSSEQLQLLLKKARIGNLLRFRCSEEMLQAEIDAYGL